MSEVISEEQRRLNQALHKDNEQFGNRADGAGLATHLPTAIKRMHELGCCDSVLDYGTGKGRLVERLRKELPVTIEVSGYDPAIAGYETKPTKPADILTCLDVLEHIETESIDAVLADIKKLTKGFCYLVIDLQPAVKRLADGRNAHILLAPPDWWSSKLGQLFPCTTSFPVYHKAGPAQKIVIAAAHDPKILPMMYGFLIKLRLFGFRMSGGILNGMQSKANTKKQA